MNNTVNKRQEINWVNAIKTVCIILIYINHCEFYCECELGSIRLLYLPFFTNAFFFVSGYLLFRKQLSNEVVHLDFRRWKAVWGGAIC